jgi:hypothetical protein
VEINQIFPIFVNLDVQYLCPFQRPTELVWAPQKMGIYVGYESASSLFVDFGDLDNNTLKGLISLLSVD